MKISRSNRSSAEAGFGLIELMVATLLLLIVMAGFLPLFLQGLSQSSAARFKSVATNIAREKVEQIRQLDYREITTDPLNPRNLGALFGDSVVVPERNMTYLISYEVADEAMPDQAVKSVQVTVTWNAPPIPSPAVVKTMVAQQYLGPRGSWLEVDNTSADNLAPGGTPFPLLATDGRITTVKYHIAQSDWFMAYNTLSLPLPSPNNISLTSVLRDDAGGKVGAIEVDKTGLHATAGGSPAAVDDIWFQYSLDARTIPDGYWDLMVTMLNAFKEPGNTWTLRVRVEKGPPDPPTDFTATATSDTTVSLVWLPGTERDRARYVLERMEVDGAGNPLGAWTAVTVDPAHPSVPANALSPNTATFTDKGALDPLGDPLYDTPPCGRPSPEAPRYYQYRVYGVDTGERAAPESAAVSNIVALPATNPTAQVEVPAVTNQLLDPAKASLTAAGLGWSVTEEVVATPAPGTVLTQNPVAGTLVDLGSNVALTVAAAAPSTPIDYAVTITTKNKNARSIVVIDQSSVVRFSGSIDKKTVVELNLPNGHYTIRLSVPTGAQLGDFYVSGAPCSVSIP